MRHNRRLGVVVAAALAVAVGTGGGGGVSGPVFPPGVEELLPHAVVLWQANVLRVPVPMGPPVFLHGVVDVNSDGVADLVGSTDEKVWVLLGDGRGGFRMGSWAYFDEGERVPATYGYFIHPVSGFWVLGAVVEDLDGDGRPNVAAVVLPPDRSDEARLYVFTFDRHGGVQLADERELEVSGVPMAAADFTGDGHTDLLLITRDEPATVLVLPGKGELRFGEPYSVLETDARPFLFSDANASGVPDLGVYDDDGVTVFLGDSRGAFLTEALRFRPPAGPIWHCEAGDLDGDGRLELVVLTPGRVHVAKQQDAEFVVVGSYELPIRAQRVILCDVHGDGAVDLVTEETNGQRMAIYAGDGQGGFRGPVGEFALVSGYLVPHDLTGDGRCDFLHIVYPGIYIIYLSAVPRKGETRLPLMGSRLLAVGDLSGNGAPDLVAGGSPGLQVFWNNGQGGFVRRPLAVGQDGLNTAGRGNTSRTTAVGESSRRPPHVLAEWREPMAAVIAHRDLYVLFELCCGQEEATSEGRWWELCRINPELGDEEVLLSINEQPVPLLAFGDLDGNGLLDIVVATKREVLVLWDMRHASRFSWNRGELLLFCTGDYHGVGRDELAVVSIGDLGEIYHVSFSGHVMEVGLPVLRFPVEAVPFALECGDLDGDGIPDLAVLSTIFSVEQDETGVRIMLGALVSTALSQHGVTHLRVEGFPTDDAPWPWTGLALGDFTSDGRTDVAFTTIQGAGVFVLPGRGDGTFDEMVLIPAPVGSLSAADLDGNGEPELLGILLELNPSVWVRWNGGVR